MAYAARTFKLLSKPLRRALLSAGFALMSVWFVATSVASIHFEEQILPLFTDASHSISAKSADMSRGLSTLLNRV
jgi:hypothetical protein